MSTVGGRTMRGARAVGRHDAAPVGSVMSAVLPLDNTDGRIVGGRGTLNDAAYRGWERTGLRTGRCAEALRRLFRCGQAIEPA